MGLFTKKEKVHYERDAEGNITNISRTGNIEKRSRTPVSDALLAQQKQQKPSRWEEYKEKRANERQIYKETYEKAKVSAIKKRATREAQQRYNTSALDRFASLGNSSRSSGYRKPSRSNANPFGSLFDTGFSAPRSQSTKKKNTSKSQYVIKGGKAYPIVGTSTKKKKKRSTSSFIGGYDMYDNWGFMK